MDCEYIAAHAGMESQITRAMEHADKGKLTIGDELDRRKGFARWWVL